jgi:hypothetical protein
VAQDSAFAGGEDGSQEAPSERQVWVADGVNAPVDPVQPAHSDAPLDGALAQAERSQLLASDHAVLPHR